GGTATADKTEVAKGETITVTVTPNAGFELESIEFGDGVTGGYQLGKETSSTVPDDFTTGTGKLQIDVVFKETAPAATHTVTFEPNGGSAVPSQTVNDGEKATKLADPTRSGFVFDGWYADATFAAAFDFDAAITADVTVYAKWKEEAAPGEIVYTVVSGGNSTWTKGSSSGVTIVVKRDPNDEECFSHFTSVQIGSTTLVSGTDYTAVAGSTVITLNASALQKLTTGTKTVTINFDDGKAATDLTIKAGSSGTSGGTSPKTGDNSNPGLWLAVMVLSGLGIGGLVVNDKKRRYVGRH
ncbi:MAG: InlB B-repeat-containing protein, partial [Oscillospiraceae bacterium]|nr:InlB B-repeat-containing protein [Oscillospiraceae bacterium]